MEVLSALTLLLDVFHRKHTEHGVPSVPAIPSHLTLNGFGSTCRLYRLAMSPRELDE